MTQKLNRGQVWLANLNPGMGTEPGKTRLVLILQAQVLLDIAHPSTLIVPLTTNLIENAHPLRVRVNAQGQLEKNSDLLIDQLRAIDNQQLVHGPLATLADEQIQCVDEAVCEVMGIDNSACEL